MCITELLKSEKPNSNLVNRVVDSHSLHLVKVYEDYLDRDLLNNELIYKWPYYDPEWFYQLLIKRGGNVTRFFMGLKDLKKILRQLPVTKLNAKYISEYYTNTVSPTFVVVKKFFLAYPTLFDVDVLIKHIHLFKKDDEVLNFVVTIEGIFEKDLPEDMYLKLVSIVLLNSVDAELLVVVKHNLQEFLKDTPSPVIYDLLSQVEYQLPNMDPNFFMACLMKAGDAKSTYRKQYFQEKYLKQSMSEPTPNISLTDDLDSLMYLLSLINK